MLVLGGGLVKRLGLSREGNMLLWRDRAVAFENACRAILLFWMMSRTPL